MLLKVLFKMIMLYMETPGDVTSEEWKRHHIFDLYEGSTLGRVRHMQKRKILTPSVTWGGYQNVCVIGSCLNNQKYVR